MRQIIIFSGLRPALPAVVLLLLVLTGAAARAQSVGIGTTTPDASAALDVSSTSGGFLPPRLTFAQRTGIANAAAGLLVYQSDTNASPAAPAGYYYHTGSAWVQLQSQGDDLGRHLATQPLNLQANALVGAGADIGSAVGLGVRADGGLNIGQNTVGNNVFMGYLAGLSNSTGQNNLFVGMLSGIGNSTGSRNYAFGFLAGPTVANLTNAGAIGFQAQVSRSNSLVLGGLGGDAVNVGIGTPAPVAGLHVNRPEAGGTLSGAVGVLLSGGTAGNPNIELRGLNKTPYIDFARQASEDFSLRLIMASPGTLTVQSAVSGIPLVVLGQVQATSFGAISDQRLKTQLRPLSGALAGVLALRGMRYHWNAEGQRRGGAAGAEQIGLLAQEVEKVYPELVVTGADGYKSVNYAQLAPVLLEAIREQQTQIDQAQAEARAAATATAALLRRVAALEAQGLQSSCPEAITSEP